MQREMDKQTNGNFIQPVGTNHPEILERNALMTKPWYTQVRVMKNKLQNCKGTEKIAGSL